MVRKLWLIAVPAALITASVLLFASPHEARAGDVVPGQYIVVFKDSVADVDSLESRLAVHAVRLASFRNAMKGFAAQMSASDAENLQRDPNVAYVAEDRLVSIADSGATRDEIRNAPLSATARRDVGTTALTVAQKIPTGVDRINAENKSNTGAGVNVAVIDTGILTTHPDLKDTIVGGKSCVSGTSSYIDQNGHGTHVAGTIAAQNNTQGVVGVAPGVKLWAVRVLDRWGNGTWSSVICGIDYVTAHAPANGGPIKVANLSLGGGGSSDNNCGKTNNDPLHAAICRARDAGVTIVAAAGNSNANASGFVPAAYDDAVIAVSALADSDGKPGGTGASTGYGADDTFATFSNYGSTVDIGAPGVNIYSTWLNNSYATISGTSMASPHVAGAAALYLAMHPSAVWSEVKSALQSVGESAGSGHSDPSGKHPEPVLRVDTL